jgi:mannosyltransferase
MLVWVASNVVIAAGFAPWALIFAYRAHVMAARGFWIPPLTAASVLTDLEAVAGGRLLTGVILIGVVLGVIGRLGRDMAVLCVWIVAPVGIGIVASILSTPIFLDRYVIGSLPPLLLLSAFGWAKYAENWRVAILSTAVAATASLALLRYQSPYWVRDDRHWVRDDWRGVASFQGFNYFSGARVSPVKVV